MSRGNYILLDENPEDDKKLIRFLYDLCREADMITLNSVVIAETRTPSTITSVLHEHVIPLNQDIGYVDKLASAVCSVAFEKVSPYDITGPAAPAFRALGDYIKTKDIRNTIDSIAGQATPTSIFIHGILASGKTTFLRNVSQWLSLEKADMGFRRREPEDILEYYPDMETEIHYLYQRIGTRGEHATLGEDVAQLLCLNPNPVIAELTAFGGHFSAEKMLPHASPSCILYFVDFRLMQEIAHYGFNDLERVLSNEETVEQAMLSIVSRYQLAIEQVNKGVPAIGVISKLPRGVEIDAGMVRKYALTFSTALDKVMEDYDEYSIDLDIQHITLPERIELASLTDAWMPIREDLPLCTGYKEVAMAAVKSSLGEQTKLVTFSESYHEGLVHYSQVLNRK